MANNDHLRDFKKRGFTLKKMEQDITPEQTKNINFNIRLNELREFALHTKFISKEAYGSFDKSSYKVDPCNCATNADMVRKISNDWNCAVKLNPFTPITSDEIKLFALHLNMKYSDIHKIEEKYEDEFYINKYEYLNRFLKLWKKKYCDPENPMHVKILEIISNPKNIKSHIMVKLLFLFAKVYSPHDLFTMLQ